MSRITTKTTGLRSRAGFDETIDRIAELTVKLRGLEAKRDKRIQAIRDETGAEITAFIEQRDALLTMAEDYATENREEVFAKGAKTGETALALFGLRFGQPTLKLLSRKWTWDRVMAAIKGLPGLPQFVRVAESLDKEAIKAALGDKPEELAKIGCRIDQTEAFWVEPRDVATDATQAVNTRG